jgi:hypothetical protein
MMQSILCLFHFLVFKRDGVQERVQIYSYIYIYLYTYIHKIWAGGMVLSSISSTTKKKKNKQTNKKTYSYLPNFPTATFFMLYFFETGLTM